jgi:Putative bacterial sensory transduction regulator
MPVNVEEVQHRVVEILTAAGYPHVVEGARVRVERGSSAVFITAHEWQERFVMIELLSPVLDGVASSEALLMKLNTLNEKLWFGKVYWRNEEVWLAHNLLGDHLDNEELIASVGMLAVVADRIDDELQKRFGGRRWRESTETK